MSLSSVEYATFVFLGLFGATSFVLGTLLAFQLGFPETFTPFVLPKWPSPILPLGSAASMFLGVVIVIVAIKSARQYFRQTYTNYNVL